MAAALDVPAGCYRLSRVGAMTIRMLFRREAFPSLPPVFRVKHGRGGSGGRAQGLPSLFLFPKCRAHYSVQYLRADFQRRSSPTSFLKQWGLGEAERFGFGKERLDLPPGLRNIRPQGRLLSHGKSDLKLCPRRFISVSSNRGFC